MKFRYLDISFLALVLCTLLAAPVHAQEDFLHRQERRALKRERAARPYLPARDEVEAGSEDKERRECSRGCLSQEDRRRLRRDINEAGREIYRPKQERPPL